MGAFLAKALLAGIMTVALYLAMAFWGPRFGLRL